MVNNLSYPERPEGFPEKSCSVDQTFGTARNISEKETAKEK